jgi:hypothetical protein
MTNEIFWRYEFEYSLHALEAWVHEAGRVIREWAGCQIFRFGPERENLYLLTSPFIEQEFLVSVPDCLLGSFGPLTR